MGNVKKVEKRVPSTEALPDIPNKRYFTISEAANLCKLKPHVLRYWETEFPQLNPTKRRGNRRYYKTPDIELVRCIRDLLYRQGFTIEGARQQLSRSLLSSRTSNEKQSSQPISSSLSTSTGEMPAREKQLGGVIANLENVLKELEAID